MAEVKKLEELLIEGEAMPASEWEARSVRDEECLSYVAWNSRTREALLVDPKNTCREEYRKLIRELPGYRWLGVIDTHTHADHISIADELAGELKAPLIMSSTAPCSRVHVRIEKATSLPVQAAPLLFVMTPGHTQDAMTPIWGPFLFGGDTVLFGDTGRDDLPGGNPDAHFESIQELRRNARPETILLPGHDHRGGRASSWAKQLELNPSLTQNRADFVREAVAFTAPPPKLLEESLRENTR